MNSNFAGAAGKPGRRVRRAKSGVVPVPLGWRIMWSCILAAAMGCRAWAEGNPSFRAGVARVNLTPPPELKVALGGYGERMSKPATGVHDGVWAKALVTVKGDRRFALVTADVLGFPPQFKDAVVQRLAAGGWSAGQILLLPSHTHTSFDLMALHPGNSFGIPQVGLFHKELFERAADQLAKVILDAGRDCVPVVTGSITVSVPERNRNRRKGGVANDEDLVVTRMDTGDGHPLAALVNWTAHPTFMSADEMLFSGDWPGHLQRTMEEIIGRGVTVLFYNGAEGDQSPTPPAGSASRWEAAERYGRDMGIQAARAWEKIRPREVRTFGYHTEAIALPRRQWHEDFMKTGGAEYGLSEAMMGKFVEQLVPPRTHSTVFHMGDLVILGVPGELAAQLGMEVKARARQITGAGSVAIGGLADEWVSYILSADEYRKGGYEASMSFYGETLGSVISEGIVRSAGGLK